MGRSPLLAWPHHGSEPAEEGQVFRLGVKEHTKAGEGH